MSEYTITYGSFRGWRLRMRGGELEAIGVNMLDTWDAVPLRMLARKYRVGEGPWPWLLKHGVRRPQPSGPSGETISDADRAASGRKRVNIWLTGPEAAVVDHLCEGRSVRDTIGELILNALPPLTEAELPLFIALYLVIEEDGAWENQAQIERETIAVAATLSISADVAKDAARRARAMTATQQSITLIGLGTRCSAHHESLQVHMREHWIAQDRRVRAEQALRTTRK